MDGMGWVNRFLAKHSDKLRMVWTVNLDKARAAAVNPTSILHWFHLLRAQLEEFEFEVENIYGFDKSGFPFGGDGAKKRVAAGSTANVTHVQRGGNCENVTVMVTICADGTYVIPTVLFKGKRMNESWAQYNTLGMSLAVTEKGWTDQEMGVWWLKYFDGQTKVKADGLPRLLLVDSHNLHFSLEFCQCAKDNNVVVVCYPSHTTHVLQGLDVIVFGPMKKGWATDRDEWERKNWPRQFTKGPWLETFSKSFVRIMTPELIKKAFKDTGVVPFNPDVVRPSQMAPSIAHSNQADTAHLPSPVKRVVAYQSALLAGRRAGTPSPTPLHPSQDPHMYESEDDEMDDDMPPLMALHRRTSTRRPAGPDAGMEDSDVPPPLEPFGRRPSDSSAANSNARADVGDVPPRLEPIGYRPSVSSAVTSAGNPDPHADVFDAERVEHDERAAGERRNAGEEGMEIDPTLRIGALSFEAADSLCTQWRHGAGRGRRSASVSSAGTSRTVEAESQELLRASFSGSSAELLVNKTPISSSFKPPAPIFGSTKHGADLDWEVLDAQPSGRNAKTALREENAKLRDLLMSLRSELSASNKAVSVLNAQLTLSAMTLTKARAQLMAQEEKAAAPKTQHIITTALGRVLTHDAFIAAIKEGIDARASQDLAKAAKADAEKDWKRFNDEQKAAVNAWKEEKGLLLAAKQKVPKKPATMTKKAWLAIRGIGTEAAGEDGAHSASGSEDED